MPEYLAPGVYVEESAMTPTPVPGVPTSTLDPATARRLVAAIRPIVAEMEPAWTHYNDADPGTTIIQLFAWASEALLYRSSPEFERRRSAIRHAVNHLSRALGHCTPADATLARPHYFTGRLLDAATLQQEQDYHRVKSRRHNLHLHGIGIVAGLAVRVDEAEPSSAPRIVIEPGYALDGCGNEVVVASRVAFALPPTGAAVFVSVRQWDRPCAAVPVAGSTAPAMIEEACLIAVTGAVPPPAVALARLVCVEGRWTVDPDFAPLRIG